MLRSILTRNSEIPSCQSEISAETPAEVGIPSRELGGIYTTTSSEFNMAARLSTNSNKLSG